MQDNAANAVKVSETTRGTHRVRWPTASAARAHVHATATNSTSTYEIAASERT
jgi:hypothetical protein